MEGALYPKERWFRNLEEAWPLRALSFVGNEAWCIMTMIPGARHGPCSVGVGFWVSGVAPPPAVVLHREDFATPWSDGTFDTRDEWPEGAVALPQVERRC